MFSEYTQRRQQLMAKLGNGVAIYASAPPAVNHADVEYTYRQDSDFYYLTGFNEPEAVAVLAPNHPEHQFILFVRPRDRSMEIWTGYRAGLEGAKEKYGADAAYDIAELEQKLPQYLEKADPLYYSFGRDESLNLKIIHQYQKLLLGYGKRGTGPTAIANANLLLAPLRQHKTPWELERIRKAIAISTAAHQQAWQNTAPGIYEFAIQAEMEHIFRRSGAMGTAYPSIVAAGANACILHYVDNNAQMQDGDLLLIDAGCCYEYYNADITRTFPVNGKFTPEQRALYEIVLEAQIAAIAEVKPHHAYNHTYDVAVKVITEGLVDVGLLVGDIEELIKEKKYRNFFMHGIGHWLGLDVHDVGIYKSGETWQNMAPGMVITIEPGIYIAPDAAAEAGQPEISDRWKGIGIRIEDDVLVTATGNEVLTKDLAKSIAAMEK